MQSEYKIGQYLEWCTDIPLLDQPRESPLFLLKGNEWFIQLVLGRKKHFAPCLEVYLELKTKNVDMEPCLAKCHIGFKHEETLSLCKTEFEVSPHIKVWWVYMRDLQPKLPFEYMAGNWMKFLLSFDDVAEPLVKPNSNMGLSPICCLESLSQDFGKILQDGLDHDVEFKCDDRSWKVHKNVLSGRSEVLQAMLHSEMKEGRTGVIIVRDMDVPTAQHFLNYLYCGKLPEMTVEIAKRFYEIGDKYAVDCLKKTCANYMVRNLTPEVACEILVFAHAHSDSTFKESVINFITVKRIFTNDDIWRDFRKCHTEIACEVYDRFCKSECSQ